MTNERTTIGLGRGFDPHAHGQDERKYAAANPVVRRLIDRLCSRVAVTIQSATGPILDVGTGEGLAIQRVTEFLASAGNAPRPLIGVEFRAAKLRAARKRNPQMSAVVADIGVLPFRDGAVGTVLCMEVLEHLDRPADAARELARVTAETLVVTVPFEPLFRLGNFARGKNLRLLGNDPEHIQQFTPRSLRRLLAAAAPSAPPPSTRVRASAAIPWIVGTISRSTANSSDAESPPTADDSPATGANQ